ncbi:MAG: C4-dicarboxylate ABC transporter permease [Thiotrichaceae bacterium]|nr:MAG: C4-dicarboxylate ABC transporter permease [Thiotrichaceae bacterium]
MIILAVYQIFSRNILSEGVVWIDPLLRTLVLWIGLAGAVVATRTDKHIKIDVLVKYLPVKLLPLIQRSVYFFTLLVCVLISWHATRFVMSEYEYGTIAFSGIPAWLTAIIIPVSFCLIAVRYGILILTPQSQLAAFKSTESKDT